MLSVAHEGMLQPFENRPELVAELLADAFGIKLPGWREARVGSGDLTEVVPAARRADLVVELWENDRPTLAVVIEVQLGTDERKRFTWPMYLINVRDRLECPTVLLVVSPQPAIAAWCAEPIELGHPDWVLRPLVLGPDRVPVVTDMEKARRSPELAVLSALAHGASHPRWKGVLAAFLASLQNVAGDRAKVYYDIIEAVLPAAARHHLEDLMGTRTYEFRGPFALTHIAKGEVRAALAVLQERGIEVPREARERMMACKDPDQAEVWVRRAATARTIGEVLAD